MTNRLLHLISVRRAAAILLVLCLCAGGVYLAQTTSTTTWPNNAAGIQNLTAGLPVSNAIWVTPSDVIFANVTSNGVGFTSTFDLQARFQIAGASGSSIQTLTQGPTSITAAANAEANTILFIVPPAAGWLVMARTAQTTGGIAFGQAWDQLMMGCGNLGLTGTGTISVATFNTCAPGPQILSQGYTSGFENVCFGAATGSLGCSAPMGTNQGFNFTVSGTSPGAGAEFGVTLPGTTLTRVCIQSISYSITTSATVGNRTNAIHIGQAGNEIYSYISGINVPASTTAFVYYSPGASSASTTQTAGGTNTFISVPFNNSGIGACFNIGDGTVTVSSITNGLLAGDQLANIRFRLATWTENN